MYLTWHGTNSIKIETKNDCILIDPFIRYDKRKDKKFINNFNCKNILITHGHIDHTMDLEYLYKDKDVKIYSTNIVFNRLKNILKNKMHLIKPNDILIFNDIKIKVYKSCHIKFDLKLCISTLFNKNIIKYNKYLLKLIKNNFKCKEHNETVAYFLEYKSKNIFILGSMNLDNNTKYPANIDYLILPYQGSSYLENKAIKIINTLKPKNIILSHFDNSFPPLSKEINTNNLKNIINKNINIIKPNYEEKIKL